MQAPSLLGFIRFIMDQDIVLDNAYRYDPIDSDIDLLGRYFDYSDDGDGIIRRIGNRGSGGSTLCLILAIYLMQATREPVTIFYPKGDMIPSLGNIINSVHIDDFSLNVSKVQRNVYRKYELKLRGTECGYKAFLHVELLNGPQKLLGRGPIGNVIVDNASLLSEMSYIENLLNISKRPGDKILINM